jgi:uncharacterized membrane protein
MTPNRLAPIALLVVACMALADTALDTQWAGRPLVALAFVLAVPGYAVVGHLRLDPFVAVVAIAIALSIAIGTIVAQLMLWLNLWNPAAAQVVMGVPSIVLLGMQLATPRRLGGDVPTISLER